jgi:hypothetical protein
MNQNPSAQQRRLTLDRYLGEILIRSDLADLVPLKQRGRFATRPGCFATRTGLGLLLLSLIGWVGFPWHAAILSLALAFAIETLDYAWRLRGAPSAALLRRSLWERIRPSFCGPLAVGVVLGAWSYGKLPFVVGLARAGYLWLCFRTLEDTLSHPERYGSVHQFLDWVRHLGHQVVAAFRPWIKYAIVGTLLAVILDLSSQQVWEAVGRTPWNRLLIFGGGLYLFAILTFGSLSRSSVRAAVHAALERWEGIRPSDLKKTLRSVPSIPGVFYVGSKPAELLETRLGWKNQDNLAARVARPLTAMLARRYQRHVLISSVLAAILVAFFISLSAFLIIPRDVVTRRMSAEPTGDVAPVPAADGLAAPGIDASWLSLLAAGELDLVTDPLPKLAFLEALVIVALIMFETSAGQLEADLAPAELHRWLVLGTTYLALLENEFQYLYGGFMTRRLAGTSVPRFVSMRNDVLLAPSARQRLAVFKAICDFFRVHGFVEDEFRPSALAIFDDCALAQEWASKFLRFSPLVMDRPYDLDRCLFQDTSAIPGRYWIWASNRLVRLSDFDEARWYARLVALNNHF